MSGNIQVFVRCRPLVGSELNAPVPVEVYPELDKIIVRERGLDKSSVKTFSYDKVFGPETTQAEIYSQTVAPLVGEVIQGFNCTILAYGQTGTGKTFTIEGDRTPNFSDKSDDPLSGIIPRSMKHLFDELKGMKPTICVSFLELYNEEIFDLLSSNNDFYKLRMYEDSSHKGSVIVQGLERVTVKSMEEVYTILDKGCKKRRKAVTLLNKASSRSHTIFTVTVRSKEISTTLEKIKSGKLNLVDLAGSENVGRSGAVNKRAREAGNINQSLLALGRVITSLCEKASHIPYRESKLTRLLQDSLGGQTKTAVIATISPSEMHIDETLNTLEYALRAKSIMNKPELNAQLTVNSIVQHHLEKINYLRNEIYEAAKKNGGLYASEETIRSWETCLHDKREEKFKLLSEVESLSEEDKQLDATILELKRKLEEQENELQSAKIENENYKVQLKKTKDEHELHQEMFDILQPMHDCLREKFEKSLEEEKTLEMESKKWKKKIEDVLEEQRKAIKTLNEIRSKQKLRNEIFREDSEKLMNKMRNMNDSVKLMMTECKNLVPMLTTGFDARKLDVENSFQDISKGASELESINNDFQKNIDAYLLEIKNSQIKSIDELETEYLTSSIGPELERLNQVIYSCESSLLSLRNSATEWKNEVTSKAESRRKLISERKINMESTLESTAENVKALLNKQKENMEEFKKIASESQNVENTYREIVLDKFKAAEEAVSSLDICYSEVNENEVYKTNQAHSSLKNYFEVGKVIVEELSNCGENFIKNVDGMHIEPMNAPSIFSEKWKDLRTEEDSAFSRYKNLIEEVERLSNIYPNLSEFPDILRRFIQDIDDSNEQLKVSQLVQRMADSVMERGNSFVSRMYEKYTEMDESFSKDKLNVENLVESSQRLSNITHSEMSNYQQFLENDLLKRFSLTNNEETITRIEASFSGTNTMVSEGTLCLPKVASELPSQDFAFDMGSHLHHTNANETLKTGDAISMSYCSNLGKDKLETAGSSKSLKSSITGSPTRRPRSKNSVMNRKNLQFPDAEQLAQELLGYVCEDDV